MPKGINILLLVAFLHMPLCAKSYLKDIASPPEFAELSALSFLSASLDLPMVMVLLDKTDNTVYYINPSVYPIHMDFINSQYLSLENGKVFENNNLDIDTRRFLMGFVVDRSACYALELWVDDAMTSDELGEFYRAVRKTFHPDCLQFNPTKQYHIESAREAEVPLFRKYVDENTTRYQMISEGVSFGRVVLADRISEQPEDGTIYVIKGPPKMLYSGITGFVTGEVSSAFSHACILARTLNMPAFYIPAANKYFKPFDGKIVRFEVGRTTFSITHASPDALAEYLSKRASREKRQLFADFEWKELTDLKEQRASDVPRFGAKSSNLGQVMDFRVPGIEIPPGFSIPFYYYGQFVRENGLSEDIAGLINDTDIYRDTGLRRKRLAGLRERIQAGKINPELADLVCAKLQGTLKGKGVFVRSSTNSEDMPGFTGAGLYTTVPNVQGHKQVMEAIKTVWASIWNDRAFDAREIAGLDHKTAMPAVFIQEGKDADMAGVMFTKSDLVGAYAGCVEIGAKRGLGIRVVEGDKSPERIFYCGENRVYPVGRSMDDKMLRFSSGGGVEEQSTSSGGAVLNRKMAARLAKAGLEIEKKFNGIPQDIEWLIIGDTIYIVQSRPYMFSKQK